MGKEGGNLHIELNAHGQVIGLEGTRLSSKLGVLARNGILAPLNHKDWRLVPSMYKDRIWSHIKENTDTTDDMKRILMMSFGSKWKESKHEVKTIGYDPYNIDIERLAHCPDRVEEDQWRSLVHYWSSKEAKVPDNPLEDCQQPSSLVPGVHTRKANMIKRTGTTVVGTNKKKWSF